MVGEWDQWITVGKLPIGACGSGLRVGEDEVKGFGPVYCWIQIKLSGLSVLGFVSMDVMQNSEATMAGESRDGGRRGSGNWICSNALS